MEKMGSLRFFSTHSIQTKSRFPKNIILVRHGESLGNVDEQAYVTTADWRIPLTEKGKEQSRVAGENIRNIIGGTYVHFYVSPYIRTWQTFQEIRKAFNPKNILSIREEPRLSEQQFGNFQDVNQVRSAKEERKNFGRFYYRFPNGKIFDNLAHLKGESGLDVYSRVTGFISTMVRDFSRETHHYFPDTQTAIESDSNVVIITHGLTLRLFVMRWFQYTISEFEDTENPNNANFVVMRLRESQSKAWYVLTPLSLGKLNFPLRWTYPSHPGRLSDFAQDELFIMKDYPNPP